MKSVIPLLFFFIANIISAQNTGANCSGYWLKADFTGIQQAEANYRTAKKIIASGQAHDTVIAKAYNTMGIYLDFAGKQDLAIAQYEKSRIYLKKHPAYTVYTYINEVYANENLTNYSGAILVGKTALALNKTYGTEVKKALIYHAMASSCFRLSEMDTAVGYLTKGIAILEKQKNNCYIWPIKLTLANTYIQTNNYRFATDLF